MGRVGSVLVIVRVLRNPPLGRARDAEGTGALPACYCAGGAPDSSAGRARGSGSLAARRGRVVTSWRGAVSSGSTRDPRLIAMTSRARTSEQKQAGIAGRGPNTGALEIRRCA